MANLTLQRKLFAHVVPQNDQSFSRGYAGIFHFRLTIKQLQGPNRPRENYGMAVAAWLVCLNNFKKTQVHLVDNWVW